MLTIQISAKSSLMLGSGTGRGSFIDADISVDDNGLPMFPGKRLKGLLKESAVEVLEMLNQSDMHGFFEEDIIEAVFGTSTSPASMKIGNLYLTDNQNTTYSDVMGWLRYIRADYSKFIDKEVVVNALTDIRQQTAINKYGYAKNSSLRTIRVLRAGKKFIGTIECSREDLQEQFDILLALTCSNLKHAGSGRNRGWGEIECRLYSDKKQDLIKYATDKLRNWKEGEIPFSRTNVKKDCRTKELEEVPYCPEENPEAKYMLKYWITNTSPLLFTSPEGDENMVNTLDYIPGSALLGYYANQFIRKKCISPATAQEDKHFKSWFIDGNLLFGNAFLFFKEYELPLYPTPYFIHTDKQGTRACNLLDERCEETKALGGYCAINGNEILINNPEKDISFHLVRNDARNPNTRIEGCIREEGIYHYEAIRPGQGFHGSIIGSKHDLEQFLNIFGCESNIRLGRSTNTQYGSAQIQYKEVKDFPTSVDSSLLGESNDGEGYPHGMILMYLISPLVLNNSYGFPSTDEKDLISLLQEKLDRKDIRIRKSFSRAESRQAFMSHLKIHEAGFKCWSAGSSFLLEFTEGIDNLLKKRIEVLMAEGLGERRCTGYGKVSFTTRKLHDISYINRLDSKKCDEPEGPVPDIVKEILTNIIQHQLNRVVAATAAKRAKNYFIDNKNAKLSSNLLGRLERISEGSKDAEEMKTEVERMREKAADPLKEFKLESRSLYEDLTGIDLENLCKTERTEHWKIMHKYSQYGDYKLDPDYKLYWRVFLRTMRKLQKQQQKGKGVR